MRSLAAVAGLLWLVFPAFVSAQDDEAAGSRHFGATWQFVDPPSLITPLFGRPNKFSADLLPKSRLALSPILTYSPQVTGSRFADTSLTFSTTYYQTQQLIPVSVDAVAYVRRRTDQLAQERFSQSVVRSIQEAQQGKRRTGLSIGVGLPKRFDKIFGEGGGNLRVTGVQRVSFAGRTQYSDAQQTDGRKQSKFPSLELDQISRFEIVGTIGTKISVKVSQDNQTEIPLANRIQLRYKGDDDDILKVVEAGNTTLSLPNTRFVGYSSQIQGLFGLKAEAQLGNLKFSAIASQEKGSSERESVTPSGEQGSETVREYQFAEGRVFDLGYLTDAYGSELQIGRFDSIIFIEVYEHDIRDSANSFQARMFINARDTGRSDLTSFSRTVPVKRIPNDQFTLEREPLQNRYVLQFTSYRRDGMAVRMVVQRKDAAGVVLSTDTVGSINQTPFILQYIRAVGSDYVNTHPTWNLMWRNVYNVPRTVKNPEDLQVKIFKGLTGQEGTTLALDYQEAADGSGAQDRYLRLLGLDQFSGSARGSDNKIDDRPEIYRPDWGLLIFPSRRPFDSDTTFSINGSTTPPLRERVSELYERQISQAVATDSKYYIQFATRTRASTIRLNRANIIEGSERLTVNGDLLAKGVDYNIIYEYGQVTLLSDRATDPNSDLRIEFEYAPFLALAKKTLLGARAEYEWNRNLSFGSTVLFKSDKAQDRKPRVGQETSKSSVADIDMKYATKLPFVTAAVNALPLIKTEAASTFQLAAEAAQSAPNPNTSGIAYIDDFESAVEEVGLGNSRYSWQLSSEPVQLVDPGFERSGMLWHSLPTIPFDSVYSGERPANQGTITPFRLIFRKNAVKRTIEVDTVPEPDTLISITDSIRSSWAGITRYFGRRIDERRVQLFELRVKGNRGKMHFDFGRVSEDIDGDQFEDTEDYIEKNNVVDADEDVGLDSLASPNEPGYHPILNPDPNGDDWSNSYDGFNGTEGNRNDALSRPDEEQLSNNGYERNNSYFSFFVDLADTTSDTTRFVSGSSYKGWKTYRIPVREPQALAFQTGSPDWDQITHVRVWFEADSSDRQPDTVEVADWYFVQSNWQDSILRGTDTLGLDLGSFVVASISDEDDSNFVPPPGVEAYFDNTNNVTEAQRALLLSYRDFQPDDTGLAIRELISVEGYSGYKSMELFVHGPDAAASDSIRFFFRVGQDSLNFYEFRTYLAPGWDSRNFVKFDFNELTGIKDSIIRASDTANPRLRDSVGQYYFVGQPNLNSIRYFVAGVVNVGDQPISGEIWIDELRVTDVRRDKGHAYRVDLNGQAADLFTYNFGYEFRDAFFRGISTATRGGSSENLGTGRTSTIYRGGMSLSVDKFFPRSWNASLPVTFNWNETREVPLQRTSSDIVIPESQRLAEQSYQRNLSITAREQFAFKTKNPLVEMLFNRPKVSFSYSRAYRRSPQRPRFTSENYNLTFSYNTGIRKLPTVPVFGWTKPIPLLKRLQKSKLKLFPENWDWSGSYARNYSRDSILNGETSLTFTRFFDGRTSVAHQFFPNLGTNVSLTTRRDLSNPDDVRLNTRNFKFGLETNYTQSFSSTYDPKLVKYVTSQFSYGANYSEQYDRSFQTRRGDLSRNWNVSGNVNILNFLGKPWKRPASARPRPAPAAEEPKPGDRIIVPGDSTSIVDSTGRLNPPVAGAEVKEPSRPLYDLPRNALRFLLGWIKPPTYKYGETFNTSLPGLTRRPGLAYTLGITDSIGVPLGQGSGSLSRGRAFNLEFGSGARFFGGLSIDARYKKSVAQDVQRATQLTRTETVNFPDLTITISRFTKLPLFQKQINRFIDVFSPRTSYSKQKRTAYVIQSGTDSLFRQQESETITQNPLLSITFKVVKNLSLTTSLTRTQTITGQFNSSNNKQLNKTDAISRGLQMSTRYSFSSPGGILIPPFGRLRFKSTVSIDLAVRLAQNTTFVTSFIDGVEGNRSKTLDNSELSILPTIAYTFNQQIQGGLSLEWRDNSNGLREGADNHTRALSIWTEIKF